MTANDQDRLRIALKEWAVICRALGDGRQAMVLRKGGIEESGSGFAIEHSRFWLFPTFTHQQRAGIKPDALPLLQEVEADRPPEGVVRLTHFAEVGGAYHVHELFAVLLLNHLHLWSEETVRSRFAYRHPGLFVIPVRVYRVPQLIELPETPHYAGCRSWVDLDHELPTDGAEPVMEDTRFADLLRTLDRILNPTALA